MNERIQKLAEQAGYTKDMFGVGHWDMPECKKFAELIVRECAAVALREDHEPYECILNHFGVRLPPVKTYSGGIPNYCTEPEQRREWVSLTDEEKGWCVAPSLKETMDRFEVKLKEKNT